MKGQLNNLIHLQDIDTQLIQTTEKKTNQPRQLEEARRPLEEARAGLEKARSAMDSASKTKRDKEGDLQAQEEKITKLKSRQTEIKTNKEYQALLHELEAAKEEKGKLEEDLLILMDESDNEAGSIKHFEQACEEAEKTFKAKERTIAEEGGRIDEAIKSLNSQRGEVVDKLEAGLLKSYERLRREDKRRAVVPVIGEICGGCHMNIPPQLVAEVKLETHLHVCSYCQRILYWESPSAKSDSTDSVKSAPS